MAGEGLVNSTNATSITVNAIDTTAEQINASFRHFLDGLNSHFVNSITANPFLFFIASVALAFILSYGFTWVSRTIIKALTSRTKTELDDILLEKLSNPVALFIFILFLSVALVPLSLSSILAHIASMVLTSANIILVAVMVNRIVSTLVDHFGEKITSKTDSKVDDQILPILRKMITAVIYSLAVLVALGVWGVNIAPLLAGAGIAGVAIAFSMQESLKNIFGGVSLALDNAYGIGDRIKLADGTVGKVIDISLRSTKIRTFTGDLMVVPNGKISNESFQTYAQPTSVTAVVIPFGVAYGTEPEKVREIILPVIKTLPYRIENKEADMFSKIEFIEMGQFSLNFRAMVWVEDYTKSWEVKLLANEKIYGALRKANIEIPFPTQSIILRKK